MSLLAFVASATLAGAVPVHTIQLDHRAGTYRVDYRPQVETSMRTIGMSAGTRPSTQRCVVTAKVAVERAIRGSGSAPALTAMLPSRESFTRDLPGDCRGRDGEGERLLASRGDAIAAHLAQVAATDRPQALAAIDSAQHLAAN